MNIVLKIAELEKLNEVAQGLTSICEHPQIQFATFQFIQSKPDRNAVPFVKTTYPSKWVNHYLQHNLMHSDPVVRHSLNTKNPFFWSEIKLKHNELLMMQQARSFGLSTFGYSVPTIDVGPYKGLLSINAYKKLASNWKKTISKDETSWRKVALKLHQIARKEVDPEKDLIHNISRREMECLNLIADGKTYGEVAGILGISEHTVRGYFRSLRHKLNCSTLAQVVGRAKNLKLI